MAKSSSLPRWFHFTPSNEDGKQTLFGEQQRPHSSYFPVNYCELNEEILSQSSQAIVCTSSSDSIESHDNDHPAERDLESGKPIQISRLCTDQTLLIVKIMAMVLLAIVIACVLSVPLIIVNMERNSSDLQDSMIKEDNNVTMCQTILFERQSCFPDAENLELEASLVEQAVTKTSDYENLLNQLLLLVPVNEQCEEELRALVCAAGFIELCDTSKISTLLEDCERTTTTSCATEFPQIQSILGGFGTSYTCDSLVGSTTSGLENNITLGSGSGRSDFENSEVDLNSTRSCSEGFFVDDDGLCKPECGEWWPRTPSQLKSITITNVTLGSVGIITILIVLILACLNYKTIFKFPGIFIVYQMLSSLIFSSVLLLSYVDIKGLMCKYRDLTEVLMPGNAGTFCTISGAVLIYFTLQIALWWLFHISMIFISVFWPFKYKYWKKLDRLKYIHGTLVTMGLILPLVPVLINYGVEGYVLGVFYPPFCFGRNPDASFYSYLFPMMCAVAVGIYLLILIFAKFFLEEFMSKKKKDAGKRQVEIKILILLLTYAVSWPALLGVMLFGLIESEDYDKILEDYFRCQASGIRECSDEVFDQFSIAPLYIITLISLYPISFLIYFLKRCWS